MKAHVQHSWTNGGIDVWLVERGEGFTMIHTFTADNHPEIVRINDGQLLDGIKPTFSIPGRAVKDVVDGLVNLGIRPDKNAILEGELIATKEHLSDMRKLAFRKK